MTLFGALTSGVSGLTAQSSAIGAISDNITNVNTIGYKGTQVDFQTLVTVQTSSTFYSAGGVQSRPRQDTGVQGLLQSSTSQTDIAISGSGFFVVNGNERLIRLLIVPRRNHVLGLNRPSYRNRGPEFTPFATVIRCTRQDNTSLTVGLNLLTSGSARLRLTIRKSEYFIPLVLLLKALRECSDREIYERACGGTTETGFSLPRLESGGTDLHAVGCLRDGAREGASRFRGVSEHAVSTRASVADASLLFGAAIAMLITDVQLALVTLAFVPFLLFRAIRNFGSLCSRKLNIELLHRLDLRGD